MGHNIILNTGRQSEEQTAGSTGCQLVIKLARLSAGSLFIQCQKA